MGNDMKNDVRNNDDRFSFFYKLRNHNEKGMTLIEVMIASAIGVSVFFYVNKAIVQVNKSQLRFERKETARVIKKDMTKMLQDVHAWISGPEDDVPRKENDHNFYFFKNPSSAIKRLSFTESEVIKLDEELNFKGEQFKCPKGFERCRVVFWSYGNQLMVPNEDNSLLKINKNHFRAIIGFETVDQEITRSFLPEFRIFIMDTNRDNAINARSRIFHVNSTGSRRKGNSSLIEVNGKRVDIVSRKKCFLKFVKKYSNIQEAYTLCSRAESLAPVECYTSVKRKTGNSDAALITCAGSQNSIPQKCFKEASGLFKGSNIDFAILCSAAKSMMPIDCMKKIQKARKKGASTLSYKVCSRAEDLGPAECFLELEKQSERNLEIVGKLCPHHK